MAIDLETIGVALNAAERNKLNQNFDKVKTAIVAVSNAVPEAQAAKLLSEEAKAQAIAAEESADSVQTQINQLVVEGDSSVEAAQARVSVEGIAYDTLKDRLDTEHQEVTGKLAEKATKEELSDQLVYKRDKTTKIEPTDASDALLTMFSPAGSVSPVVGPNSIDANKTTFIREQENLFNKATVTNGYINGLNGNVNVSDLYKASDFIPVVPGVTYKTTKSYDYAFYNSSKVFISSVSNGNIAATIVPPANAVFVRIAVDNANLDTTMFSKTNLPSTYLPFGIREIIPIDPEFEKMISKNINVSPSNTTFFADKRINLFDKLKVTNPGLISFATGAVLTSYPLYSATDFIPVNSTKVYKTTASYDGAWYTESKVFISGISGGNKLLTLTPPANAKFLRLTFANSVLNTSMVVESELPSSYIPYEQLSLGFRTDEQRQSISTEVFTTIKPNIQSMIPTSENSKWANKVWNVVGDSITEVNSSATLKYHDVIKAKIGCTVNNYGISGTGWRTPNADSSKLGFYQRLDALAANADLITVFGGTNDWAEVGVPMALGVFGDTDATASLYGAIDYTLRALVTKYPTKTIAVFTPIQRNNNWADHNANGVTLEMVADAIIEVANKYSIPVLDLYRKGNIYAWDANFRTAMMPDGLHPNNTGHAVIADKILAFINNL